MRALRYINGETRIVEIARPEIGPSETLVRIECVGVCRTDVYVAKGRYPSADVVTLGHEFCGVVESSSELSEGDRVSADPFVKCGVCKGCTTDQRCESRRMIGVHRDGAFANYIAMPTENLIVSADDIDPRRVAYIEPIAAALAPLNVLEIQEGSGCVFGAGRITDLTAMVLADHGHDNFIVGRPDDQKFDWVVETSADPVELRLALQSVKRGGTLVLKSRPAHPTLFDVRYAVENEITIRSVHYGDFVRAAELSSSLDLEPLFGETVSLQDFERVFANAEDETRKVFLEVS